jgi:serine/threonine protein kinase
MTEEKRERFGKYLILDHLVDGGMAKICRAKFLGEQASKVVAIKMVQPQFSKDDSFKQMFMDEVKLTFGLLHPNIIQTYDYGMHNDQLFVAMEYCDGRNLKEYLDKLKQRKFVFPVEITVYIITQICQGLHYAHTYTDKLTGKEANIVHRDISPHNVMLTYEGAVKVIDFGIAKAESNSEATQAGTIKGKLSYLAPEYLEGMELDPRYDLFAVGISMWEMLCSRKLFKANNDLAVLKKIQECKVPPPSSINPNVPKELDEIVLKALSRDRTKRHENMDQLNRALIRFLYAHYPEFNATDLQYFAKELFKDEIKRDREKLFEFGKIDLTNYLRDLKRENEGGTKQAAAGAVGGMSVDTGEGTSRAKAQEAELDFGFKEDNTKTKSRSRISRKKQASDPDKTSDAVINDSKFSDKNAILDGELKIEKTTIGRIKRGDIGSSNPKNPNGKQRKTQSGTSTHTRKVRLKKTKKKSNKSIVYAIALMAVLAFIGKDYLKDAKRDPAQIEKKDPLVDKDLIWEKNQDAVIVIDNFSKQKHTLFVDGVKTKVNYLKEIVVPSGKEVTLRIQHDGRKHFVTKIVAEAGNEKILTVPEMDNENYAYLVTSRRCIAGTMQFEMYGESRKEVLPISGRISFPAPSGRKPSSETSYEITYQRVGENLERKVTVDFSKQEEVVDLCKKL